jgi:hypothetical protein
MNDQPAPSPLPSNSSAAAPEQGQLVEVRRRQWVVGDVGESAFRDLFAPTRQGLVSLVSVDEDSLGEELQVLWQLEPGARVLDRAGLPTISGCDDATRLEAFLDAVRWGAATAGSFNPPSAAARPSKPTS